LTPSTDADSTGKTGTQVHKGMIIHPENPYFYNLVGAIPEAELKDNPEAFLSPREGKDTLIADRFDAGELYGYRLSLKHLRSGTTPGYVPTQAYKDVAFIKGFLAGYNRAVQESPKNSK
jgi:hypothetical protein